MKLKVKEYDQARQDCIESLGIKFIRFSNQQVIFEFDKVLKIIKENLISKTN